MAGWFFLWVFATNLLRGNRRRYIFFIFCCFFFICLGYETGFYVKLANTLPTRLRCLLVFNKYKFNVYVAWTSLSICWQSINTFSNSSNHWFAYPLAPDQSQNFFMARMGFIIFIVLLKFWRSIWFVDPYYEICLPFRIITARLGFFFQKSKLKNMNKSLLKEGTIFLDKPRIVDDHNMSSTTLLVNTVE